MNAIDLINSTIDDEPPAGLTPALLALWYVHRGEWTAAHDIVQDESDRASARVHAYLHRKEGDEWNARYWYNRSGCKPYLGSLEDEFSQLIKDLSASST